jgi:hypothetical protein
MRPALAPLAALLALFPARAATADEPATEPGVHPTLLWAATQLLPSPGYAYGQGSSHFDVRWQLTPLLYSWGMNRRLSPWRLFVVEPYTRQSGSIELFVSPEYVTAAGSDFADGMLLRTGVRSYFPLVEHGEYLSCSLGASHYLIDGHSGAAVEAGAYVLFGTVGLQLTYSPSRLPTAWIATFRIRYF